MQRSTPEAPSPGRPPTRTRQPPAVFVRPTPAGFAYGVVALCLLGSSFIQRVNLLILVSATMIALAGVSIWHGRRRIGKLTATRRPPEEAFAGQPVEISVQIYNPTRSAAFALELHDRIAALGQSPEPSNVPVAPARGTARATYRFAALPRGRHLLDGFELSSAMPLGLFATTKKFPGACELLVYPRIGELTEAWRQVVGRASFSPTNFRPAPDRAQEEFHGVREYRSGDNPRHIHWRSTARRGQLVVREFEALAARDMVLVVDPFADSVLDPKQREAVESIVGFAATALVDLCKRGARQGGSVTLAVAGSAPVVVYGTASNKTLARGLAALAGCAASAADDWRRAIDALPFHQVAAAQVWFLGTRQRTAADAFTRRFGAKVGSAVRSAAFGDDDYRRFFHWNSPAKPAPLQAENGVPSP